MSIQFNGGSNPTSILYNGNQVNEVYYNGTKVWPDETRPVPEFVDGKTVVNTYVIRRDGSDYEWSWDLRSGSYMWTFHHGTAAWGGMAIIGIEDFTDYNTYKYKCTADGQWHNEQFDLTAHIDLLFGTGDTEYSSNPPTFWSYIYYVNGEKLDYGKLTYETESRFGTKSLTIPSTATAARAYLFKYLEGDTLVNEYHIDYR